MSIPDSEKRPTTKMIAEMAGVTTAAVSMALHNSPRISVEKRREIQRIAKKLGYRPDPEMAKLMQHLRLRHKPRFKSMIAALTTIPSAAEQHYAKELCKGAKRAAGELGYGFSVFRLQTEGEGDRSLQRTLQSRGIEGILLLPMKEPLSLAGLLDWERFSVVAATHAVSAPDFHRAVPDQFGNTLLICKSLARSGHRRIGLVVDGNLDQTVNHGFSAAVAWQNTVAGTEDVRPLIYNGYFWAELKPWFERERPDAIIVPSETHAREIAQELRLEIPGSVEFAVADRPRPIVIGGVDQRPAEVGAAAISLLHSKIQTGEKGVPKVPTMTMVKGCWQAAEAVRDSKVRQAIQGASRIA